MPKNLLELARKAGTDKEYREWIQTQRSCLSGAYSEYLPESGDGRCIAAHIRRASNSGVSIKPEYACVPVTDAEHRKMHQHGDSYFKPKFWWDDTVKHYLERWIVSRI